MDKLYKECDATTNDKKIDLLIGELNAINSAVDMWAKYDGMVPDTLVQTDKLNSAI